MPTVEEIKRGYQERIADAAARDAARRSAEEMRRTSAFIDAPFDVCGIRLRPMTIPDYVALIVAGNAHVTSVPQPEDQRSAMKMWGLHNMALLWFMSEDFRANAPKEREAFTIAHADISFDEAARGIGEYMQETFADAPRPSGEGASNAADPIGAAFPAHWQHKIAACYGWSREEIRAMPLKELFQYLRLIDADTAAKNGKQIRTPLDGEVDRLWSEMLRDINAAQSQN